MMLIVILLSLINLQISLHQQNAPVTTVRNDFLQIVQKEPGRFHAKDIESVRDNNRIVERYTTTYKDQKDALDRLVKTMDWRKSFGINDLKGEDFPEFNNLGNILVTF